MLFKEKSTKELESMQKELELEIKLRKEEEKRKINEAKRAQTMALIKAADENPLILDFFPHSRNSCNDSLKNSYFNSEYNTAECNRCLFEEMVRDYQNSFNKDEFQPDYLVSLEISFEKDL